MAEETTGLAIQAPGDTQPTNKVAAASNAAMAVGALIAGVLSAYGGPAIIEMLGEWGVANPSTAQLLVMIVTGVAGGVAGKYVPPMAAYNVLDKPNVALQRAAPPAPAHPAYATIGGMK
jgi:hypothetical protein